MISIAGRWWKEIQMSEIKNFRALSEIRSISEVKILTWMNEKAL